MHYDSATNTWTNTATEDARTKCPKCGSQTVAYRQEAYGDSWTCQAAGCSYSHYFGLGD